jgi:NADPH2:quinone reductase
MYAIEVEQTGGPEVLSYVEKPRPSPAPGEVSIKAEAIGVNFVDTYFRSGLYPHEPPFVLGAEVAGTVAAVGEGVTALRVGDRVRDRRCRRRLRRILCRASRCRGVGAGCGGLDVAAAAILKA